jgi:chorismate mutase/prephenate dehydratase
LVVVAARPEKVDARVAAKTSLILATKHEQGALLGCLNALATRQLNLTKLESRPRPHTPWEYLFYVDFEGNIEDPAVVDALAELRSKTSFLRVLGCYPARTTREARPVETGTMPALPGDAPARAPAPQRAVDVRELEQWPHRLSSRKNQREDTIIELAGVSLGGPRAVVIANIADYGSRAALLDAARASRAGGAGLLRAPCFEPAIRERCDTFGADPLELLEEVGKLAGLPVIAEVLHPSDVDRGVQRADVLLVGASNMQNQSLLREVGRVDRPVILERGIMASIDEWLTAAEYVLERGNHRVILCERGIRTFERSTPSTLDLSAVAIVRERSHLPVLVDPSFAAGRARWALLLAESARAAGAQGVVIDVQVEGVARDSAVSFEELGSLAARLASWS